MWNDNYLKKLKSPTFIKHIIQTRANNIKRELAQENKDQQHKMHDTKSII